MLKSTDKIRSLSQKKQKKDKFEKRSTLFHLINLSFISLLWFKTLFVTSGTPHRIEELFHLVSLVVSLPAHFTVEPDFVFVTCEAPECFLLHTAFGAVNVFITLAVFTAFWEGFLCTQIHFNSITIFCVFFSWGWGGNVWFSQSPYAFHDTLQQPWWPRVCSILSGFQVMKELSQ